MALVSNSDDDELDGTMPPASIVPPTRPSEQVTPGADGPAVPSAGGSDDGGSDEGGSNSEVGSGERTALVQATAADDVQVVLDNSLPAGHEIQAAAPGSPLAKSKLAAESNPADETKPAEQALARSLSRLTPPVLRHTVSANVVDKCACGRSMGGCIKEWVACLLVFLGYLLGPGILLPPIVVGAKLRDHVTTMQDVGQECETADAMDMCGLFLLCLYGSLTTLAVTVVACAMQDPELATCIFMMSLCSVIPCCLCVIAGFLVAQLVLEVSAILHLQPPPTRRVPRHHARASSAPFVSNCCMRMHARWC